MLLWWGWTDSPRVLYMTLEMKERRASVVRSPRLAAMGVAMLSGLTLHLRDITITAIMIEPAAATQ